MTPLYYKRKIDADHVSSIISTPSPQPSLIVANLLDIIVHIITTIRLSMLVIKARTIAIAISLLVTFPGNKGSLSSCSVVLLTSA